MYTINMKKQLGYDSPFVELHQRLFYLLVKIDELRQRGRAYYEFTSSYSGQPQLDIKLYTSVGRFKQFKLALPTTEANFDNISIRITKLIDAIEFEEQIRQNRERHKLIQSLTPEQRALLNIKEQRNES